MPWTFAHPAAVLPLRRFCPWPLNLAALSIGAMTPDVGYYVNLWNLASNAHSARGSVLVCLPIGLFILACFYLLRKPVWFLLPEPHRTLLQPLVGAAPPLHFRGLVSASMCVVAGAWTHIAWDALTHVNGWIVAMFPALQERASGIGVTDVPIYHVLQHLSTLVGIVALAASYFFFLRRSGVESPFSLAPNDYWRVALISVLVTSSLAIGTALSIPASMRPDGTLVTRLLVFFIAVKSVVVFVPLLIASALVCSIRRPSSQTR